MKRWNTARAGLRWREPGVFHSHAALAMAATAIGATLALLSWVLPRALILPTFCLLAIIGAAVVAIVAWESGAARRSASVTAWDVAGALALIGCAAAMLSDTEQVVRILDPIAAAAEN